MGWGPVADRELGTDVNFPYAEYDIATSVPAGSAMLRRQLNNELPSIKFP